MSSNGATTQQERTFQWIVETLDQLPVKVKCSSCGQTIGRYRPGRVSTPSLSRPAVHFSCVRAGCHTETVVLLNEDIA